MNAVPSSFPLPLHIGTAAKTGLTDLPLMALDEKADLASYALLTTTPSGR